MVQCPFLKRRSRRTLQKGVTMNPSFPVTEHYVLSGVFFSCVTGSKVCPPEWCFLDYSRSLPWSARKINRLQSKLRPRAIVIITWNIQSPAWLRFSLSRATSDKITLCRYATFYSLRCSQLLFRLIRQNSN